MFKHAGAFSHSQQPPITRMLPAQSPTNASHGHSPSSSRRKQQNFSQKQPLKHKKKQASPRDCSVPFSVSFYGEEFADRTPTKKKTILRRGEPASGERATPPKSQLYAGPTFHNSPAPSSLPLPAFMTTSPGSTFDDYRLPGLLDFSTEKSYSSTI